MATWQPDPSFYPSPRLAAKAPPEQLAYVAAFDPARLDSPLGPGGHSAYLQFHGVVQHDLWHAGQIAALRKA